MLLNFGFLLFYINFISFIRPAKERRRGKTFPPLGHTLNNKNTVHWYSMTLPSATPPTPTIVPVWNFSILTFLRIFLMDFLFVFIEI